MTVLDAAPVARTARPTSSAADSFDGLVDPRPPTRGTRSLRVPRSARRALGPLVLVGLWQAVCSTGLVDRVTLPSPIDVVSAGRELAATGELQTNLAVSLQRVAIGLTIGVTAGLVLALAAGLSRRGEDLLDPAIQIIRAVPILGLVPMALIWFGVGEAPKVFLIALGCAFPVYLNTFAALRAVDARYVEAATTFGLSRGGVAGRVLLPAALPGFLVGLRFALVSSWLIIIVAEQINATSGLGYLINSAQSWGRADIIFLGLAIYGALGLIADGIIRLLEARLLSWRNAFTGT